MSTESNVLYNLWADIIEVLENNLGTFTTCVPHQFVPRRTVQDIMSKNGVGNNGKANEIMSTVVKNITTPERFNDFVEVLRNSRLDTLAQLLVEEYGKCTFFIGSILMPLNGCIWILHFGRHYQGRIVLLHTTQNHC